MLKVKALPHANFALTSNRLAMLLSVTQSYPMYLQSNAGLVTYHWHRHAYALGQTDVVSRFKTTWYQQHGTHVGNLCKNPQDQGVRVYACIYVPPPAK